MEVWVHFSFSETREPMLTRYIKENGLPYDDDPSFSVMDIGEKNPHWEAITKRIEAEHAFHLYETKFTQSELSSAKWLTVRSQWYYDYPQPEDQWFDLTYTQENRCADCRIGLIQKDDFRFKRTPKWGRRNFCMTNWVYDELFVSPRAKEMLESSNLTGFSFLEVKKKGGSERLPDIWQLWIPTVLPEGIADLTSNIADYYVCSVCGKRKLRESGSGMLAFHEEAFADAPDFAKSGEWFGGDGNACRKIIASHKAYQFITDHGLGSSLVFEPIDLV